jgi:hypothetical protein
MGQRHQVYIVTTTLNDKGKTEYCCIGAYHHQWLYGITATSDALRMRDAILKAKLDSLSEWSKYALSDHREVDTLAKAIYGLDPFSGRVSMVHNENEYLIDEEQQARPERGDNNDGCTLFVIDNEKKEVRYCLFSFCGIEAKHSKAKQDWKPWSAEKYLHYYYTKEEIQKGEMEPERLKYLKTKNLTEFVVDQKEFNKIMRNAKSEKECKQVEEDNSLRLVGN